VRILADPQRPWVYAIDQGNSDILFLNLQTGSVEKRLYVGKDPTDFDIDATGTFLYVANKGTGTGTPGSFRIGVVALSNQTLATSYITTAVPVNLVAGRAGRLYYNSGFYDWNFGDTHVLDTDTGVDLGSFGIIKTKMVITADKTRLFGQYVYDGNLGEMGVWDVSSDNITLVDTLRYSPYPYGWDYDNYCLSGNDRYLGYGSIMFNSTNLLDAIGLFQEQVRALNYDGSMAFGDTAIWDTTTFSTHGDATKICDMPFSTTVMTFDCRTNVLYAFNEANHSLSVIEPATTHGIPYSWLRKYGLATNDVVELLDPDEDAASNLQEYLANTNPTDRSSHPVTWLAGALRVRTDGTQHLLWRHLTNGVPDGQVSLWTLDTNATLQNAVTCGPFADWTVVDLTVSRQANTPHLVWTNTSGAISIWNFNSSGDFQTAQTHGPFAGWSYSQMTISPTNNDQWVLWKHNTGQVSLWRLNSNSVYQSSITMGPFTNWSAEEFVISPVDGKVRVLWKNTDGTHALWRLGIGGFLEGANLFGPAVGWTVQTLTVGPVDNKVRILWENTSGAVAVWRLTTADAYESSATYGPFSGWLTLGMTVRPDNKLQLPWDRTADHAFSLWRLDSTESFEAAPSYGPYTNWQVFGGDVDGANKSHLLWRKTDGAISLWRLSPTGALENTANFGPY
jgi:DNA-binding beta-propeller fold protein YncE